MVIGLVVIFLIYTNILTPLRIFIILVLGIIVSLLSKKYSIPVVSWFLKKYERKDIIKQFPGRGLIFFTAGILLALQLFERNIALASIMVLVLGDSVSHIIGKNFGRTSQPLNGNGKKKLEGTIAGITAGFIGALFFVNPFYALAGSVGGMLAETMQFDLNKREVGDNVIIPIVAGTIMFLLRAYIF